jgi:hypothetical protein
MIGHQESTLSSTAVDTIPVTIQMAVTPVSEEQHAEAEAVKAEANKFFQGITSSDICMHTDICIQH